MYIYFYIYIYIYISQSVGLYLRAYTPAYVLSVPAYRTAARVVRGLSRSPHTSPKNLMDADIVRFLLCLLEEGDEPATEQEVR